MYRSGSKKKKANGGSNGNGTSNGHGASNGNGNNHSNSHANSSDAMDEDDDDDDDDSDSDSGTLLTVQPGFNRLLLVLRDEGVMRFVKYVSAAAESSRWDVCGEYEVGAVQEESE